MKDIREKLQSGFVFFDGGTGSILQERGLLPGEFPELWNLKRPEEIVRLHREYLEAGADVIPANTFGANSLKFNGKDGMPTVEEIISAAVENAKEARRQAGREEDSYVALDLGPSGRMLKPLGDFEFEDAVALFAEEVRAADKAGVDLVMIETMNDSYETKAAVLAVKENSDLPVFVTNVYDESAKLMTGASPEAMVAMLEGLRVDALGLNCSLGPAQMIDIVKRLVAASSIPVLVNPNAGLPRSENGKTVYDVGPEEFVESMVQIAALGARGLGGCCGTTPEYIRLLRQKVSTMEPLPVTKKHRTVVSSYTHAVEFNQRPVLIGERINPTGKKKLKAALTEKNMDYILDEAVRQEEAGVDVLDINVGLPEIDEDEMMKRVLYEVQAISDLPLQIDTTDAAVMEHALRMYNGKAMVNSTNGKEEVMDEIFPLVAKYGGLVVALTIDEDGIPDTWEKRVEIAERIIERASQFGIGKEDIIVDPLAMTISSDNQSALVTLRAVEELTRRGIHTSLGVSNVSFGLPIRPLINGTFFTMTMTAGLSAAIMNPFTPEMMQAYHGFVALKGLDENCMEYITYATAEDERRKKEAAALQNVVMTTNGEPGNTAVAGETSAAGSGAGAASFDEKSGNDPLKAAIEKGLKERAGKLTGERLNHGDDPLELVNSCVIPALNEVGKGFEEKTLFLPQLLMSAEAAGAAFDLIKDKIRESNGGAAPGEKVIVATVKGDIHDIGKNIVKVLLENYGFDVIDLGKDVPPEVIVDTAMKEQVKLVGLSALMTTTVPSMEETIKQIRAVSDDIKVVVGGAVLTQEYADMIHADCYAKDAMETVRYAEKVLLAK